MCGPEMAGSSPREREVGSLWCSAYPRLVGVTSPVSCPHPFVNPFTRHSNLSSFLPSFLISNPFHRCSPLRISFIDIFALPTHASRCIYIYTPATGDHWRWEVLSFPPRNRSCDKRRAAAFSSIFGGLKETFYDIVDSIDC